MALDPKIILVIAAGSFILLAIIIVIVILAFTGKKKPAAKNGKAGEKDSSGKPAAVDKNAKVKTGIKEIQKEQEKPIFQIDTSGTIPKLPDNPDITKIDVRYPLIPPYTFAHVHWRSETTELIYDIEEPVLNAKEKETLSVLEDGIRELINLSYISVKDKNTILIYLEKNVKILLTELSIELNMDSYLKIMYYIYRDFVGLNEMEPLLNDYYIEDIECNGTTSPVYLVHRKYRNVKTNLVYSDIHKLASFVEKLAQKAGKYISYAEPLLDGTLPDGSRVNATYTTDISSKGPTYTIRKFTKEPWSPVSLISKGTVNAEILAYAWMCIEYENSFMVIGGTGSGKTSFLNAVAFFIPPQARIVSIEDTRELSLEHENWLPSVSRAGVGLTNILGQRYGEVSLFDLLKESFRQRPDYIIVGEVRGAEAYILFQGMASGHPSMGTMHAENVETMVRRLETPPINLSGSLIMSIAAVFVQAQSKIRGKEVRRMASVDEVIDVKEKDQGGNVVSNNIFKWDPVTDTFKFNPNSKVFQNISVHFGFTKEQVMHEFTLRATLLREMNKRGVTGFKEVQKIIEEYYKDPATVLKRFGIIR